MPVVFEFYNATCALGDTSQACDALLDGKSGIVDGPCFGVPVRWAPFANPADRDLRSCALRLFSSTRIRAPLAGPVLFIFCCAKGDIRALDFESTNAPRSESLSPILPGAQAECVERIFVPRGADRTIVVSNACASGAIGLELAHAALMSGDFRTVVIFGYDSVSRFVATGFHALGALSADIARPFDKDRDGLTLGDGAAVAVLTNRETRPGDCVLEATGCSNDANHRTGPSRTGEGLLRAARSAITHAALHPADIGAVKCHGTATPYNDAMEAKALAGLFANGIPPCVSLKGALGHTSGGGSLLEIIIACELLKKRTLPPTFGFRQLGVEEAVPISNMCAPINTPRLLCLSAGFGGINAAAVISEAQ